MPSARDHPFNQSRRPLLECRPGQTNAQLAHDDEDEDDYEDIHQQNHSNPSTDSRCDFKTYGFARKFAKASPTNEKANHNNLQNQQYHNSSHNNNNIYNAGFHDFNAIPRANGTDVGYPYGEKIIKEKLPIGAAFREPKETDFLFPDAHQHQQQQPNNKRYLNNVQTQSHYQNPGTLTRKFNNNQNVQIYNNTFSSQTQPDFANRPLPQTPTANSPLLQSHASRQRPSVPRAVCPTPPMCRANRKGPFIFGVDGHHTRTNSSNSSPAGSPMYRRQNQRTPAPASPVIDQWKYSENSNNGNRSQPGTPTTEHRSLPGHTMDGIKRRDVFQRSQNAVQNHHDVHWDPDREIREEKEKAKQKQKQELQKKRSKNAATKQKKTKEDKQTSSKRTNKAGGDRRNGDSATVKCVIVGDAAVGKTNLIISYLENRFVQEHVPTASDIYNGEVEVDGTPIQVTLTDTAGQNTTNINALRELCYSGSDVFLVCFSVVNPESFRSVQTNWIPTLTKKHKNASVILIGTQSDLRNDQSTIGYLQMQGEKPVSMTDAWDYARSIGAKYVESSSRTKDKVKDAFDTAIWDALLSQQQQSIRKPLWRRLLCLA